MPRSLPFFLLSSLLLLSCDRPAAPNDPPAEVKETSSEPGSAKDCPAPLPLYESTVLDYRSTIQGMITAGEADERGKAAAWKNRIALLAKDIEAAGKEKLGAACWDRYLELSRTADAPFEEPAK